MVVFQVVNYKITYPNFVVADKSEPDDNRPPSIRKVGHSGDLKKRKDTPVINPPSVPALSVAGRSADHVSSCSIVFRPCLSNIAVSAPPIRPP